jgi:hypothetical protein
LEEFMARENRGRGHGGANGHGMKTSQKLEDMPMDARIKAAESIAAAAERLQRRFVAMGMTKSAAGSMAFDLVGGPGARPCDFKGYNPERDHHGGH